MFGVFKRHRVTLAKLKPSRNSVLDLREVGGGKRRMPVSSPARPLAEGNLDLALER